MLEVRTEARRLLGQVACRFHRATYSFYESRLRRHRRPRAVILALALFSRLRAGKVADADSRHAIWANSAAHRTAYLLYCILS